MTHRFVSGSLVLVSATLAGAVAAADRPAHEMSVVPNLTATPTAIASTVPANGDVNPYGIAFVPARFPRGGVLRGGDVVVANFNNGNNLQGTGTTLVRVNPGAAPTLFFESPSTPGFSTALGVLERGFVIVGYVPSSDGSGACTTGPNGEPTNVGQGALLVIDRHGRLVQTLADPSRLDGPWDLAVEDRGARARVFVSNVLDGTVTRLDLVVGFDDVHLEKATRIASGYVHRCDSGAFVVGPTGLALDRERDVLYVAATGDNAFFAIRDASDTDVDRGMGRMVVTDPVHLHGPVGLVLAPDGHLIAAQGDAVSFDSTHPSEIVELTDTGRFVGQFSVDSAPGSAFGVALESGDDGFRFVAVDDGQNVVDLWNVRR